MILLMSDPERLRHRRRMPLWVWVVLSLILLAVGQTALTAFADWRRWPDWTHTIIRAVTFTAYYAVVAPRISRERRAFSERRRLRKQSEV